MSYWSDNLNSWVKRDISAGIYSYDNDDETYQAETDNASLRCDPFGPSAVQASYDDKCVYYGLK